VVQEPLPQKLATHHRKELERLELRELVELSLNMKWLKEMHALRNVTMHAERDPGFDVKVAAKKALYGFFERRGRDLAAILDARDAVKRVGRG
jgi:hypothetical protein